MRTKIQGATVRITTHSLSRCPPQTPNLIVRSIVRYILPQTLVLPVEDPWNKHLADWSRNRRELSHSRRDVQAAVDKVAERIDLVLKVLLGRSVHLLEFLNWEARGAYFGRVEVADFCLELIYSLLVW